MTADDLTRQEARRAMKPTRWWRVILSDGSLWCETSDEKEARRLCAEQQGARLQRLYEHVVVEHEWRDMRSPENEEGQP